MIDLKNNRLELRIKSESKENIYNMIQTNKTEHTPDYASHTPIRKQSKSTEKTGQKTTDWRIGGSPKKKDRKIMKHRKETKL